MKRTFRLVCVAFWLIALAAQGAAVDLVYEHATSPTGPWRPVAASDQTHRADGSITVESGPIHFYRLRIDQAGANAPSFVRLGSLTPDSASRLNTRIGELSRFLRPLAITRGTDTSDPTSETLADLTVVDAWRGTTFASNTIPIYDPAYRNGLEPAYLEIKVLGSPTPRRNGVDGTDRESGNHRGSILMSLGDQDVGIPYFNTEGETPTERLVAKLGLVDGAGRRILTPPAGHKVLRYGPTFHVLEDPTGEAVASLGTQPYKVPADLFSRFPNTQRGEAVDGADPATNPDNGQSLGIRPYSNYAELKTDYLSNPTYQELRRRRALRSKLELDLENGRTPTAPPTVRLALTGTSNLLSGVAIDSFYLDDDNADIGSGPFVAVTELRTGGLRLVAQRYGEGELTARAGRITYRFHVTVPFPIRPLGTAGSFTPGWQEPKIWNTGGYDEQPRYWQESRERWCPKVGCGPVAWAILLAWWDRHNVPSAFAVGSGSSLRTSLRTQDAPFYLDSDDDPSGYGRVIKLYDVLHDSCDVMCWGAFSDAGSTPPGDMVEAWWEPTKWGRRTAANGVYWPYPTPVPADGVMAYAYHWAWDLMDPDWNEPSNVIRSANKKGRPAIVGLGWLWHYGVSYAYRVQAFKVTADGPAILTQRWFKVNEGWGKDHGEWYSGGDTFLGFDLKLRQRSIPPPL